MNLHGKSVLITGANGGIGGALITALLEKNVGKIYATARSTAAVAALMHHGDKRVVPHRMDITHAASVRDVAQRCHDIDLLINNAGLNHCVSLMSEAGLEYARKEMEVNYFGTLTVCRAFAPGLMARGNGAIVNVCSIIGMVNLPANGTYCASKAAGHSLLQGIRAEIAPHGVRVIGVYPGPVETRMTAGQEIPKATPAEVADAILSGIEDGSEDIFPDPMSREVNRQLQSNAKGVEKQFASMVPGGEPC